MKKEMKNPSIPALPMPNLIVSCRDKNGRNNVLAVGASTYVASEPLLVMISLSPERFSHHIIKETGEFVINVPEKNFKKEYYFLGSQTGKEVDKFEELQLKYELGKTVDAPLLLDCPINMECKVVDSVKKGNYELFFAITKCIYCDEKYITSNGTINLKKLDLID